jgi:hypothetical protein
MKSLLLYILQNNVSSSLLFKSFPLRLDKKYKQFIEEYIIKIKYNITSKTYHKNNNIINNVVDNKNNNDENNYCLRILANGNEVKKQKRRNVFSSLYMNPDQKLTI